jgi:hypothetical protein
MHIRCFMIALALSVASIQAGAQSLPAFLEPLLINGPPRSTAEVILLVRGLAETGACARANFYSVPVMRALFGPGSDAKVTEYTSRISASTHGLQELVLADDDFTRQSPNSRGVWLDARRPRGDGRWDAACFLNATFRGQMSRLDYPSIKAVLGEGERNKKAEMARDLHIIMHARGKPIAVNDDPMGGAIIDYPAGAGSLTTTFDKHGKLWRIDVSWPNDVAVPTFPP